MTKKQNKFKFVLLLSVIFFLSSFLKSNALSNEQLSISINKNGQKINITETWNMVSEGSKFERTLPISRDDINNIAIETIFPSNKLISFTTKYHQRNNATTLTSDLDVKHGETFVLKVDYELTLDKNTSEKFLNALPNSLFYDNSPTIDNIKVDVKTNDTQESASYNRTNTNNKEFTQETSKSQTLEVILLLLKILFGIVFLCVFCTIAYALILYMYYKNIQSNTGVKFKRNRRKNKKIKNKKPIHITKKF